MNISLSIKGSLESKKLKNFMAALPDENANADVLALLKEVVEFASSFPTVGF